MIDATVGLIFSVGFLALIIFAIIKFSKWIAKTIRRHQDIDQYRAETERMKAQAEAGRQEPRPGSTAHFEQWKAERKKRET